MAQDNSYGNPIQIQPSLGQPGRLGAGRVCGTIGATTGTAKYAELQRKERYGRCGTHR